MDHILCKTDRAISFLSGTNLMGLNASMRNQRLKDQAGERLRKNAAKRHMSLRRPECAPNRKAAAILRSRQASHEATISNPRVNAAAYRKPGSLSYR